jgi:hypothetical protein
MIATAEKLSPAQKAWLTRRARAAERAAAGEEETLSQSAAKAWETRRKKAAVIEAAGGTRAVLGLSSPPPIPFVPSPPKPTPLVVQLLGMRSGECRWIQSESVHVYCWAPCEVVAIERGRSAWLRRKPVFKVRTAQSRGSVWSNRGWVSAEAAAVEIEDLVAKERGDAV